MKNLPGKLFGKTKSIESDPIDRAKTLGYADLLISYEFDSNLATRSTNGTIVLALFSLFGFDSILVKKLSEFSSFLNMAEWKWILYLSIAIFILAFNFYYLLRFARNYTLVESDWSRYKDHIFRERELKNLSNFKSKEVIRKAMPLYVVLLMVFLGLFGIWITLDTLFISPITKILALPSYKGDIFNLNYRGLLSVFMFTLIPPIMYLLVAMFLKNSKKYLQI